MRAALTSTPHAYCTYFDSGYLARGIALIDSLRANGDESAVWVMALDDATKVYLDDASIPGVHVITIAEIEEAEPELAIVKATRSRMEYCFTCTPLLIRFVMAMQTARTTVIYLDADMYFFDDPQLVLDAMGERSIGIIEHRYSPALERRLAKYGRFNVGWVGFRADANGRDCLDWWAARTLEWCFDTPKDGKYADQGYLDSFPRLFDGVSILEPLGLDLAPWNTARYSLTYLPTVGVRVEHDPLVFFHFHGLRRSGRWYITSQLVYGSRLGRVLRDQIYRPYIDHLEASVRTIASRSGTDAATIASRGRGLRGVVFRVQKAALKLVSIVTGTAIAVRPGAR